MKRGFRPFLRLWNLKCVVLVPDNGEVVLARFTSVASKRKVGGGVFFGDVADRFLPEKVIGIEKPARQEKEERIEEE